MAAIPPEAPKTHEDLIPYIKAAGETPGVDAKGRMLWDGTDGSASLAKDIMAATNSRNGGIIVIGKAEHGNQFELTGLTEEQADSFDTTKVANWVNSRCSPPIELTCSRVEYENKEFIVLVVNEFEDIPVICTKEYLAPNAKKLLLRKGSIYVRTANSESAPLSTPEELRKLIGLATMKRGDQILSSFRAMLKGQPVLPSEPANNLYAEESAEMNAILGATLDRSATMGTWTFQFYPERFIPERWETEQLPSLVRENAVRSRGDLYPGGGRNVRYTNNGIMEDGHGRGVYGFNRSGLFMYRYCYPENSRTFHSPWQPNPDIPEGRWLEFPSNLHVIAEFFWFMGRMAHELEPGERLICDLSATGLQGRSMVTHRSSIFLHPTEPCVAEKFSRHRSVTAEELRGAWESQCVDIACEFFRLFLGNDIQRDTLHGWVKKMQQPGT